MLYNNLYAAIICFVWAFGFTNEGLEAISHYQQFSHICSTLFVSSMFGFLAQLCSIHLISNFGALADSITTAVANLIMTISFLLFAGQFNPSPLLWTAIVLVFTGLFLFTPSGSLTKAKKTMY